MNWATLDKRFPDGLNVPAFLRIPADVRRKAWAGRPVRETQLIPTETDRSRELREAAEAQRKERSLAKLRASTNKRKRRDAMPADFNTIDYRWNSVKGCFERNPFAHMCKPAPVLVEQQKLMEAKDLDRPRSRSTDGVSPSVKPPGRAPAKDDLGAQVSAHCGTDRAKLKHFAQANGCWTEAYDKLPNPGLVRMSVVNRLRAKVKHGHKVVWK